MKKLFFIFFFSPLFASAQTNLIPNPSFEIFDTCPDNQGQISYAVGWESFGWSPDYFNICSSNPQFFVPTNYGGYQQPATGNAYGFFGAYLTGYFGGNNVREFIAAQLSTPLTIGTKYYASLKVSLSLSNPIFATCACNHLGAMFSTVPYTWLNPAPLTNAPPVYTDSIITDTVGWTGIFGSFISDSAYQYIIIGNFFDDNNTDTLMMDGNPDTCFSVFYYLDDICVSTDSALCSITAINELEPGNQIQVYPNPFNDFATVIIKGRNDFQNISLYDLLGKEADVNMTTTSNAEETLITIHRKNLSQGIYFIKIQFTNQTFIQKILINN